MKGELGENLQQNIISDYVKLVVFSFPFLCVIAFLTFFKLKIYYLYNQNFKRLKKKAEFRYPHNVYSFTLCRLLPPASKAFINSLISFIQKTLTAAPVCLASH